MLPLLQYDVKARRTFLKKTRYESLPTEQLRPGNTVVVYGRQLRILDYADAFTRRQLEWQQQRCACRDAHARLCIWACAGAPAARGIGTLHHGRSTRRRVGEYNRLTHCL